MNSSQLNKSLAKIYRDAADQLDPPKKLKAGFRTSLKRGKHSRLDQIKAIADSKPFDEAEAARAIRFITDNCKSIMVNVYTAHALKLVHGHIRKVVRIDSGLN